MRTAFIQFDYEGVELSYECRYEREAEGLYDIEATLVMVGPDQEPPTPEQVTLYAYYGQVWGQFYAALEEADYRKYRPESREDAMASNTRI
jgi:hypothetical protein